MKAVQRGPRQLAVSYALHRWTVARPLGVRERPPIRIDTVRPAQPFCFLDDATAPIDNGPEDIKRKCLYAEIFQQRSVSGGGKCNLHGSCYLIPSGSWRCGSPVTLMARRMDGPSPDG